MKRVILFSALVSLASSFSWAQHGGGHGGRGASGGHMTRAGGGGARPGRSVAPGGIYSAPATSYFPRTYGSVTGYGNVVFPGTGSAPGTFSPFSITDPTFAVRLGQTVSGFGYPYGYGGGYRRYGHGANTIFVPYAVPVYVPNGGSQYSEPPPPPPPQIIYVVPGEPDRSVSTPAPPPQREGVMTYVVPPRDTGNDATHDEQRPYLIALKNHSIYSAIAYWLEGDTLHYVTPYGAHNQASLDQVDVEFTNRLNRDRGIDFKLGK